MLTISLLFRFLLLPLSHPASPSLVGFSDVYSIAAAFITSCPDSNPTLPVKAFPAASISEASYKSGDKVTLKYSSSGQTEYRESHHAFDHSLSRQTG